jgi:PAS domain S-box-containing protein
VFPMLSWNASTGSLLDRARLYFVVVSIAFGLAVPVSALDPNKTISQFTHTSWSVKDGIPAPVGAIAQTRDGYLWFATHAGLYRFDGQSFVSWEPTGTGDKLPRSSVMALLSARDGSLWIGFASSTISRLQNGVLKTYTSADGLHTGGVLSIAEDLNGTIWAGGASGFSCFSKGRWSRVGPELGYRAPGARQLLVDHRGTLWAATDGFNFGLNKDSIRTNTILKLRLNGKRFEPTGQPVGYIAQLAEAPDGSVWMAEGSGPGPTVRPVEGHSNKNIERAVQTEPWCILFDGPATLWIGLLRSGIRRATDFHHLERVSFDRFESKDGLSSDSVRVAFKDREGNIWFGSNRGVDRFRENKVTPFSAKDGLSPNPQLAVTSTTDGSVWIINYPRDLVQHFTEGRLISQTLPPYSRSDSTRVLSTYSRNNRVWLGGSFGLAEGKNGKFAYVRVPGFSVGNTVEAITSDSSDNLWIEVWKGYKSTLKRLRNGVWADLRNRPELPDGRCRVLFGDAVGRVWLGFESGDVVVYDDGRFRRYSASNGLPAGKVLSIAGDRAGHIWIGGEGGLSQFDGQRFIRLTQENGLPGNSVSAVLEDHDGSLWIAGELGIIRVRAQELQNAFKSPSYRMHRLFLDTTDGLPGFPAQGEPFPTATKSADGRLWFSATDGIAVIDPHRLPMNTLPPPVAIQTVIADNRRIPISSTLQLQPKVRNIEIAFAVLSLSIPERVLCRYKLEGYDTNWHGPIETRLATYTNLPPGPYRFRVIGCNDNGVWNKTGATLAFRLAAAWYQTWWFRGICAAAFLALIWGLHQYRMRQVQRQEKQLRDVIETVPALAFSTSADGTNQWVNRRWVEYSGLSAEAMSGSGWLSTVHRDDVDEHVKKWQRSLATGEPFENEARLRSAKCEWRWFLVRAVPLRDANGTILKWYGTMTDIEERIRAEQERERSRQLEAELAHVNRVSLLGELAASLSHELKQPIAAAITNANTCLRWLKRDQPDLEEACAATTRIVDDGNRAAEIINRLRSFYKKGAPLGRELVDVNEVIRNTLVLLRSEANRYSVAIRTGLCSDLPRVNGDRVQLQQVCLNLMLNAIEAMKDKGGQLTIKSELGQDGHVLISVIDTGVGLPAGQADQIFNPFFTTKPEGSGMGLTISRSIIESHGGRLWASANLERGATIQFTLPKV